MFHRLGSHLGPIADSRLHTGTAAIAGAFAFGGLQFALGFALARLGTPQILDAVFDAMLCGGLFALLLWVLFTALRERRQHVREELERIAELNHEIRNALQVIADSQFDIDARHRDMVLESIDRIDIVLNRVFPARAA